MSLLLFSLLCTWPHAPATVATSYAQIVGREHRAAETVEHLMVVVISRDVIIRADPRIAHLVGRDWPRVKQECRVLNWPVLEMPVPQLPACSAPRFQLRLSR